jgi:hypothetical protein
MREEDFADQIFAEYLELREQLASGRRPQAARLRVSVCCHQQMTELRGWSVCSLCRRQAAVIELETIYKVVGPYNHWKKIHVRPAPAAPRDVQERWTIELLDRWVWVREIIEPRPRALKLGEWRSMLRCWSLLLVGSAGRDEAAREMRWTAGKVRYQVERARDVVRTRACGVAAGQ